MYKNTIIYIMHIISQTKNLIFILKCIYSKNWSVRSGFVKFKFRISV